MKNRILGITVLLAVVVMGFAFIVSCGPGEDTSVVFVNKTTVEITVTTDGNRKSITLPRATLQTNPSETETKAGTLTLTGFNSGNSTVDGDFFKYVDLSVNAADVKGTKKGMSMGSGTVTFVPRLRDDDDAVIEGNPANQFSKISVIALDE
jgi:hypothetical protein